MLQNWQPDLMTSQNGECVHEMLSAYAYCVFDSQIEPSASLKKNKKTYNSLVRCYALHGDLTLICF